MRFVCFRDFFCLLLAFSLNACGGGQNGGSASSGTIRNFSVGQNGTFTSPWGDGSASLQPAMAVKLTPSFYPVTFTSVTIYPSNTTGSDQAFNVRGFSDLSAQTEMFPPVLNQAIPDTGGAYAAKTITIPPTTISSGSFYIAVEWVTKPLASASGSNAFFLRTDSHLDAGNASFVRYAGSTWSSLESISAGAGDLGILANYGEVAAHDNPVVAAVVPARGATGVSRSLQELKFQFNKEMGPDINISCDASWALSNSTPARWSADHTAFFISRDNSTSLLPAETLIQCTLNTPGHARSLTDIFGNALEQATFSFTTGQWGGASLRGVERRW
ncbi:hypothetical protein GMLC_04780 [Geomonas limicola]|uniref:SbsA Ig-like domain-containing protein n=1 Tax=Geomonas limicola TaxID=2740186 RepID=A0A6V8N6J3_9BACT|nr:hypothetical protein [Geomonas limicola]GFO66899.1 hypothetical protein GMLC_04780 [Geomonas limicola]